MMKYQIMAIVIAMSLLLSSGCGATRPVSSSEPQQISVFESSSAAPEKTVDPEMEKQRLQQQEKDEPLKDGTEFIPADTGIEFTTPYIKLCYPEELQGKVELVHKTEGARHTVTFKTVEDGVELFSFIFSPQAGEPGFQLGTLNDPTTGAINIFSVMNEDTPPEWSEEQYNEFSSMQERVNDLIIQLYEDERFEPGR